MDRCLRGSRHGRKPIGGGRLSRGLGLGEGKVFLGRLDGRLLALDQQTGEVLWDILAADPGLGYGITAAPLYYDGKVVIGITGGEYAIRGRISAYDSATGDQVWNFYTIPGPGEIGHATWPQDNDAWKYGGAPVWQTPSIDPELGMIYFSTGNAGPDLNGAIRAGDNLFAATILALDVQTGEYRWHFQVVRHDIWDFDAPNPTILFDAEFDGMPRKGIAQVSKAGYLYILDRRSGVPLTPVIEMPVPQDAVQQTAATQPIPQGDWVIRHDVDVVGEDFEGVLLNGARTFTPFNNEIEAIWRPFSGVTWNPSSYNIENNLMYICAGDGESTADPLAFLSELNLERTVDFARGAAIYGAICETCHGDTGQGGTLLGAPLPDELTVVDIVANSRSGIDGTPMPPFAGTYSLEELHDVASYIHSEILTQR